MAYSGVLLLDYKVYIHHHGYVLLLIDILHSAELSDGLVEGEYSDTRS